MKKYDSCLFFTLRPSLGFMNFIYPGNGKRGQKAVYEEEPGGHKLDRSNPHYINNYFFSVIKH
ncbi:hypothetical protein, partial [Pseudomonas lurida]|uniref:hypothetical protein n=1 Tax=Pseudomonas lurida TaxID=244566 RepID=UPI0034D9691D